MCASPTVLYWSIWIFSGTFVMACRCACGFGIIISFFLSLFSTFELSHFCPSVHYALHTSGMLRARILKSYSISIKNTRTRIFSFFRRGSPCGVILLFQLRHLATDGGNLICATPHTVLYRLIRNLASSFVMVCRCAYGFGIIVSLIFVTFFRLLILNTIKVHYSGHLVCATSPTALYRSIWNRRPFCL